MQFILVTQHLRLKLQLVKARSAYMKYDHSENSYVLLLSHYLYHDIQHFPRDHIPKYEAEKII